MAKTLTAARSVALRDTREVFRIEAEVSAGAVASVRCHCVFLHRNNAGTVFARQDGVVTIEKQYADLPNGLKNLLTSLVTSCNRPSLFRLHIEVAEADNSFRFMGHHANPVDPDVSPVTPTLTGPQTTGINNLIAVIDGE